MVGEEVPRRDPHRADRCPARRTPGPHPRTRARAPHPRPPGDGAPRRRRLDGAAHRPPPRRPRADGPQVHQSRPSERLRRPPRPAPPRAPTHRHRSAPRCPRNPARRRRADLDDRPIGGLAGARARGPGPPRPAQSPAPRPPLRLEAHRHLAGPQTARPGGVRRQSGRTRWPQKKARTGVIDLWFLDQSGFCPTLPTGSGWGRLGRRLVVPYEAPQGRRVDVVGALAPYDPAGPRLVYETRRKAEGRYDAAAHLAFVRRLAGGGAKRRSRPCVVVLDNYAVHHSQAVKDDLPSPASPPPMSTSASSHPTAPSSTRSSRSGATPSTRTSPSAATRPTSPSKPPSRPPSPPAPAASPNQRSTYLDLLSGVFVAVAESCLSKVGPVARDFKSRAE